MGNFNYDAELEASLERFKVLWGYIDSREERYSHYRDLAFRRVSPNCVILLDLNLYMYRIGLFEIASPWPFLYWGSVSERRLLNLNREFLMPLVRLFPLTPSVVNSELDGYQLEWRYDEDSHMSIGLPSHACFDLCGQVTHSFGEALYLLECNYAEFL